MRHNLSQDCATDILMRISGKADSVDMHARETVNKPRKYRKFADQVDHFITVDITSRGAEKFSAAFYEANVDESRVCGTILNGIVRKVLSTSIPMFREELKNYNILPAKIESSTDEVIFKRK
jgi:hypothetical protein